MRLIARFLLPAVKLGAQPLDLLLLCRYLVIHLGDLIGQLCALAYLRPHELIEVFGRHAGGAIWGYGAFIQLAQHG